MRAVVRVSFLDEEECCVCSSFSIEAARLAVLVSSGRVIDDISESAAIPIKQIRSAVREGYFGYAHRGHRPGPRLR